MRKTIVMAFVAMLAISAFAPLARGVEVPIGTPLNGGLKDYSSVFGANGLPLAVGAALTQGDEQRSIFTVSSLFYGEIGPSNPTGTDFIVPGAQVSEYNGSSLTGMLYDLDFRTLLVEPSGSAPGVSGPTAYWTAGSRYIAGVDWVDTYTPAFPAVDTLAGYGAIMVIYADDTIDWNPATSGGDSAWSAATGPALGGALPNMSDEYPTVSDVPGAVAVPSGDASPFLILALTPLPSQIAVLNPGRFTGLTAADVLVEETFYYAVPGVSAGHTTGFAFANVIGGSFASSISPNTFGPGRDVRFDFDVVFAKSRSDAGVYGWLSNSDDPLGIATIPEPATMSLLTLGLLGLVGFRKRKV